MAKLVTAADVQEWAAKAGEGPRFLVARELILTPGAIDTARALGVQILYPGPGMRSIIRQMAEEVVGGAIDGEDLEALESQVLKLITKGGS
ncbi:MAG: hypothetical protein ACOY94_19820 [Bacillota bacterium]